MCRKVFYLHKHLYFDKQLQIWNSVRQPYQPSTASDEEFLFDDDDDDGCSQSPNFSGHYIVCHSIYHSHSFDMQILMMMYLPFLMLMAALAYMMIHLL